MNSARLRMTLAVLGVLLAAPTMAATLTVYAKMGGAAFLAGDANFPIGTVDADVGTILCPTNAPTVANCVDSTLVAPATVVLTAQTTNNSTFTGWVGCPSPSGNTCTVAFTVDGVTSKTLTANFAPTAYYLAAKTYPLQTATYTPPYGGVLTAAAVPAIDCKTGDATHAACLGLAANGASVDVTAVPNAGSKVQSWSGCASVAGDVCTVDMTGSKAVSATFASMYVPVTVAKVGSGSVASDVIADTIACGTDCTGGVVSGGSVTLTATPAAGAKFLGWTGACSGTGTCSLTNVTAAQSVSATFKTSACTGCHAMAPATHASVLTECGDCHAGYTKDSVNSTTHANGVVDSTRASTKHGVLNDTTLAFVTSPAAALTVTDVCLTCHRTTADAVLGSVHFTWKGSSAMTGETNVGKVNWVNNFCVAVASNESRCNQCHPAYGTNPVKDPVTGALQVNTGAMYKWASDPAVDKSRIDCLICHNNIGASSYVKSPAGFGQPWPKTPYSCTPACSAAQICSNTDSNGTAWTDGKNYCRAPTTAEQANVLKGAAKAILAAPARSNCGFCHFNAGGGDNVKMGDLGSALAAPTAAIDFHMGSTGSGGKGMTCVSCHSGAASHEIPGAGLSVPGDEEGRVACADCHATVNHASATYSSHAAFIACQVCHVPRFTKTQYTKMNWDWRVSGDKQACLGVASCVPFGSVSYPSGNAQTGTVPGVGGEAMDKAATGWNDPADPTHKLAYVYDWKKGKSRVEMNVVPVYRWFDGTASLSGTHATTDNSAFGTKGDSETNPVNLSGPVAAMTYASGKKIHPFKRMTGRTPGLADGSVMLVPHVFGSDSLWQNSLLGSPVVPNNLGSVENPWTEAKVDAIWTGVLNYGAAVGNQLGSPVAKAPAGAMIRDEHGTVTVTSSIAISLAVNDPIYLVGAEATFPSGVKTVTSVSGSAFTYTETLGSNPAAGTTKASGAFAAFYPKLPAWKWVYTEMFINLNHEVAPKASALTCTNCHGSAVESNPMRELYNLQTGGCTDPANCKIVNP